MSSAFALGGVALIPAKEDECRAAASLLPRLWPKEPPKPLEATEDMVLARLWSEAFEYPDEAEEDAVEG